MGDVITDNLALWSTAQKKKKAVGRGSSKKQEAYGIKKLRELILELAVRGKLVPQDTNDELASVLLEKIAEEKTRLIEEGMIKKQKALPEIGDDEKSFQLPSGWEWVKLGTFFNSIISGGTPSKRDPANWGGNIPWASVKDLGSKKYISDTQDHITEDGLIKGSKLAEKGDILICTRMGLGKIAITQASLAFNQDLKAVKLSSLISVEFFLNTYSTIKIKGTGTTVAGIKQEQLLNYVIGLPPLAEQHRIVAKVDELMALCDQLEQQQADHQETHQTLVKTLLNGLILRQAQDDRSNSIHGDPVESTDHPDPVASTDHPEPVASTDHPEPVEGSLIAQHFDTLFITEESIDQLKQTILQLAVMGKLVPQNPKDEPASVLLEKIAQEKAKLIEEGKIRKQKALPEIKEDEKPFELPDGWEWTRLGVVTTIRGGKRVANGYKLLTSPTPHIYIRVSDMKNGSIDDRDLHYIDEVMFSKISQYIITKEDLYMTIVGATIGKCGLVPEMFNMMNLTENAARITPYFLDKVFLLKCLESSFCQNQFFDKTKQVGVQKMALIRLSSTLIPLPPYKEQHRIVKKVNQLLSLCDSLKANLSQAENTQTQLADAIVKQAVN